MRSMSMALIGSDRTITPEFIYTTAIDMILFARTSAEKLRGTGKVTGARVAI